jgi:DNA modification methylase
MTWDPDSFCYSGIDSSGALKKRLPKDIKPKLILMDPPYNMGFDYGEVNDSLEEANYHNMLLRILDSAYAAADDDAHLFMINYPEIVSRMWNSVVEPKNKNGSSRKRPYWKFHQWITWTYPNNWPPSKTRFTRASRTIIWMKKGNPSQNIRQIVQPYRNPWDSRVKELMNDGKHGPALYDWWGNIDLCKNVSTDKVSDPPYSNQMPETLLRRIILMTTEPGDLVADPFAGTFSTVKAALHTGRLGWGCDLNPETNIYHPSADEFDERYEIMHDFIKDKQWFDIDWKNEPFDFSRAGVTPDRFYEALTTGIEKLPVKQRSLLLQEIRRIEGYSRDWNINNLPNEVDPIFDETREYLTLLFASIPKEIISAILDSHNIIHEHSDPIELLIESLLDIVMQPSLQSMSDQGVEEFEEISLSEDDSNRVE